MQLCVGPQQGVACEPQVSWHRWLVWLHPIHACGHWDEYGAESAQHGCPSSPHAPHKSVAQLQPSDSESHIWLAQHGSPFAPHMNSHAPELHWYPESQEDAPQHGSPLPPQFTQKFEPLQVRFVPPLQSLPAQHSFPAAFPHVSQSGVAGVVLHARDAPVHELPVQHGCPAATPQVVQSDEVALQMTEELEQVPLQHGCPGKFPH